jgi:hypothetical protein
MQCIITEAAAARREAKQAREAEKDQFLIFVSQVHPKVDERDLFEFFSIVGRVEDIRLIRDQRTNKYVVQPRSATSCNPVVQPRSATP